MSPVVVQIGNQGAPHATEAAYRDGFAAAGCHVIGIPQEEAKERGPQYILDMCDATHADICVYSRTHNNTALGPEWTDAWRTLEGRETKTIGIHLDVFWGLPEREEWIASGDPQFTVGTLFTADGGSDDKWRAAGVNHRWLPPGADTRFIPERAEPFAELAGKIVFVGSSLGYHDLWPHRMEMVDYARRTWGDRFIEIGNGTVWGPKRGEDLARVYASDCIVIGDFCFAGERARYHSDRTPESLARGALLLMADKANDHGGWLGHDDRYTSGAHLWMWEPGNFDSLRALVEMTEQLPPSFNDAVRAQGRELTWKRDTYRDRAREVLDTVGVSVSPEE